ncbi:MAG: hypothetical protein NWF05_00015 [Candidatus Bathyarchaeota archaeon]|nr:hypothetical protein [Candidatus Bathyarchaeota archaeon]
MQRHEAIQILREILYFIPDASIVNCLVMQSPCEKGDPEGKSYALKIKISVSEQDLEQIKSTLANHRVKVKSSKGYLVIYKSTTRLTEITA